MRSVWFVVVLVATLLIALVVAGCGSSETKQQECQGMTEKAEHDVCVAELRQEEGKAASIPAHCNGMSGAELMGCVAAGYEGAGHHEDAGTEEVPAAAGDAEAHQQPAMPYASRIYLRSEQGYTAEAELRRGKPIHPSSGLENGSLALGVACMVDFQADAVEPFIVRVTNTTTGFEASPAIDLIARTPHWELPEVVAEVNYTEGPACMELTGDAAPSESGEGYVSFGPTDPLGEGEGTEAEGFLYLSGYYSPQYPEGDPQKFSQALLTIEPQAGGENFLVSHATGVLDSRSFPSAVAMIPGQNGGCLAHPPCGAAFKVE